MAWDDKKWWRLTRKISAYKSLESASGFQIVMADLAKFCYYRKPTTKISPITVKADPIAAAIAEGRREVFLRILEMMDAEDAKIRQYIQNEMLREAGEDPDVYEYTS